MMEDNQRNLFFSLGSKGNDLTTNGKDLHVFIPDELKLNESLDQFFDLYAKRTRQSQEYWLLDFSNVNASVKEISEAKLKDLSNLDLDDDLFLVERNQVQPKMASSELDVPIYVIRFVQYVSFSALTN